MQLSSPEIKRISQITPSPLPPPPPPPPKKKKRKKKKKKNSYISGGNFLAAQKTLHNKFSYSY